MLLFPGGAVQTFPEQIRVSVMPGVLLDEVRVDPAQGHRLAITWTHGDLIQAIVRPGYLTAGRHCLVPEGDLSGDLLSGTVRLWVEAIVVAIGSLPGAVQIRQIVAGEDPGEPIAFDLGGVAKQAAQAQGRGRYRPSAQLPGVQSRAFGLEGVPVEIQPRLQRLTLAVVKRRVDPCWGRDRGNRVHDPTLHSLRESSGPSRDP